MSRRVYRNVAVSLSLLALGACATVSTERPMFGPADAKDAPVIKPGLWALPEPGCRFKSHLNPAKWPECVQALAIRDGVIRDLKPEAGADRKRQAQPHGAGAMRYLVAAGDPAILQVETGDQPGAYLYFGLRPLAADADGAILRLRAWAALCKDPRAPGPAATPSPAGPVKRGRAARTSKAAKPPKPANGLTEGLIPTGDHGCTARTPAAVAKAVAASEPWAFTGDKDDVGFTAIWVRDEPDAPKEARRKGLIGQAAGSAKHMAGSVKHVWPWRR